MTDYAPQSEVRYERMRPREIVAARTAAPVAYLPIGTIEWHGWHNPVGLDTLKMHGICVRCAQATGGLVFPPLWYGENREEALMEATSPDGPAIAEAMGLPPANFATGYMKRTPAEQTQAYQQLLLHVLRQVRSLGFRVIVIGAGHYPLIDHARAAAALFHQEMGRARENLVVWVFTGYELVRGEFEGAGDHAGRWETSLMMAVDADTVDLNELPEPKAERLVGAGLNAYEASVEFGEQAMTAIVRRVSDAVSDRLEHPEKYRGHGFQT